MGAELANMKTRSSTIIAVGTCHFVLWWLCVGFLKATGFELFSFAWLFGGAPPHHSLIQEVVFVLHGLISYPVAWLTEFGWLRDSLMTDAFLLVANSAFWGVSLGALIYALRKREPESKAAVQAVKNRFE